MLSKKAKAVLLCVALFAVGVGLAYVHHPVFGGFVIAFGFAQWYVAGTTRN